MPATTAEEFRKRFPQTQQVFDDGVARGFHLGAQLCIRQRGETIVDVALGESVPGQPLTSNHRMAWLSAGKPLTAIVVAQFWERGWLNLDDAVADHIPEFAQQGKQHVTLRHLLTHTAGLRSAPTGWPECAWNETIAKICSAPLDPGAIPGETAGYHVASTWFLLGEVLQRRYGRPITEILSAELLDPLGMSQTTLAISETDVHRLGDLIAPTWERDPSGLKLTNWHRPLKITRPSPGSSLRGPIRELAAFYEMLRRRGTVNGVAVLSEDSVSEWTRRQRVGQLDATFGHIVDFGFGFIIDSNRYGADTVPYGYGHFCSESTFGHGGAQSSQGYCDPEHELAVAWVFNGRPGEGQHNRRCRQFNDAIYRDLGFTSAPERGVSTP